MISLFVVCYKILMLYVYYMYIFLFITKEMSKNKMYNLYDYYFLRQGFLLENICKSASAQKTQSKE